MSGCISVEARLVSTNIKAEAALVCDVAFAFTYLESADGYILHDINDNKLVVE